MFNIAIMTWPAYFNNPFWMGQVEFVILKMFVFFYISLKILILTGDTITTMQPCQYCDKFVSWKLLRCLRLWLLSLASKTSYNTKNQSGIPSLHSEFQLVILGLHNILQMYCYHTIICLSRIARRTTVPCNKFICNAHSLFVKIVARGKP